MKILHTSDWHTDKRTAGFERYADIQTAVYQTVQAAIRERVDVYAFTGDLSDPDDGPSVVRGINLAQEVAWMLNHDRRQAPVHMLNHDRRQAPVHGTPGPIANWWMPGNHDVFEDGSGQSVLTPLNQLGGETTLIAKPYALDDCMGVTAIFLPYTATSHTYDPAAFIRNLSIRTNRVVVFSHLSVEGIQPGEETTEMPRGRDVFLPLAELDPAWTILQGHYHKQQCFERDGRKVHVVGSPARLTFGEETHVPSYQIVEV